MTAERLHTFTPSEEYRRFKVTVMANAYDKDEGKFPVYVHALGQISARELAVEQVRTEYPSAMAVWCEEVAEETPGMHDGDGGCGFAWAVHDNRDVNAVQPFGCPTETTARARWGR